MARLTYEDFLKMVEMLEKNKVPGPYYLMQMGYGTPGSKSVRRIRRHITRHVRVNRSVRRVKK